jgi:hypothetical protein
MPNPTGVNSPGGPVGDHSRFGSFTTPGNPSQLPATQGGGYPNQNLPRRLQRQAVRGPRPQALPPDVAVGRAHIQALAQQPREPSMADLWAQVAQIEGASPLVQEYARRAAQER